MFPQLHVWEAEEAKEEERGRKSLKVPSAELGTAVRFSELHTTTPEVRGHRHGQ